MKVDEVVVAPKVRDLDDLAGRLRGWLGRQLPSATDLRLGNFAYPFGAGRSHETILFDAGWTEGGRVTARQFVVRIKPSDHTYYPDDLFAEQIRLMQVLHELGEVKVARIFWSESDPGLLGQPFFVMERVHGRVAVSTPPYAVRGWVAEATPAQRAIMWENGVRQLGAIARTPLEPVRFLAGAGGLQGLEQEWDKYSRFLEWVSQDRRWPVLEQARDDLRRRWPRNQPEGLVWGDARIGNMMFGEDFAVTAVMDWEQPSLGGALQDLAWWVFMDAINHGPRPGMPGLEGAGTRDETLALWREVSGKSTDDFAWYEEFTGLKVALLAIRTALFRNQPAPDEATLASYVRYMRP